MSQGSFSQTVRNAFVTDNPPYFSDYLFSSCFVMLLFNLNMSDLWLILSDMTEDEEKWENLVLIRNHFKSSFIDLLEC